MSFQGKPASANKVPLYNGTQWTLGDVGVPPLRKTSYVDGATTAPSRDGSIGKPFQTIQEAVTANFLDNVDNYISLLVAPGTYTGDVTLVTTGGNTVAYLSIASTVPGTNTAHPDTRVIIDGAITVVGSEGDGRIYLQDADVPSFPITVGVSLALTRSVVNTPTVAGRITLYDDASFVESPNSPVAVDVVNYSSEAHAYADTDPTPTNVNFFPSNYRFSGLYNVLFYITMDGPATTGTMDLIAEWIDPIIGATTRQIISALDMTTPGTTSISVPLWLGVSPVTFSINYTSATGTYLYYVSAAVSRANSIA